MAVTWDANITNVNTTSKRADVSFVRTDTNTGAVWSRTYPQVIIDTTEQRLALLDQVWAAWQQELTRQTQVGTFLSNLEQQAKANLEARET